MTQMLSLPGFPGIPVQQNIRFKTLSLRIDPSLGTAILRMPPHVSLRQATSFVQKNAGWLRVQMEKLSPTVLFTDGTILRVLDQPVHICHDPQRHGVERVGDTLWVGGKDPQRCPNLVKGWLNKKAKEVFSEYSHHFAQQTQKSIRDIQIKDTRSRWGSCSSERVLCYSWRLLLAPQYVAAYVAAHEVAHLSHMDHSHRFWTLCDQLYPERVKAEYWLKRHGASLHRMG